MTTAAMNPISTTTIGIKTMTQASSLKGFFIIRYRLDVRAGYCHTGERPENPLPNTHAIPEAPSSALSFPITNPVQAATALRACTQSRTRLGAS